MRRALVGLGFASLIASLPACTSAEPPAAPAAANNTQPAQLPHAADTRSPDPGAPIVLGASVDSGPCGECSEAEVCVVRVDGGAVPPGECQPSPCPDSELSEACVRASICAGYKDVAVGIYKFSPSARSVPGVMCGCPCGEQPLDSCVCPP